MYKFNIVDKHISRIKAGDTIMENGVMKTVCRKNIKHCSFMGTTLFGSNHNSGRIPVQVVEFIKPS